MKLPNIIVTLLLWSLFNLASADVLQPAAGRANWSSSTPPRALDARGPTTSRATTTALSGHPALVLAGLAHPPGQAFMSRSGKQSAAEASNTSVVGGLLMGVLGLIVLAELIRRRMI